MKRWPPVNIPNASSRADFQDLGFTYLAAMGIVATAVSAVAAAVLSGFFVAVVVGAIAAVMVLITFLLWWLYGRLICLDDEQQCIIGVAFGRPSVSALKKAGDNDASFNVALAPSTVDIFAPRIPTRPTSIAPACRSQRSTTGTTRCRATSCGRTPSCPAAMCQTWACALPEGDP